MIRFGARVKYHGWRTALLRAFRSVRSQGIPEDPTDIAWGNHIAVYVGDDHVIEALAHGLTRTPVDHYQPADYRLLPLATVRKDVTAAERAALLEFAGREMVAKARYGWLAIATIVIQLLTPTRLDLSVDGTMICSAFGARCWEHAGVVVPTLSPYTTMPADLAEITLKAAGLV